MRFTNRNYVVRSIKLVVLTATLLVCSYVLAGVAQVVALYFLGGGAGVPRMGYETMPYILLLSPLLPLLTLDNLVRQPGLRQVMEFAAFVLPFCFLALVLWKRAAGATRQR